MTASGIYKHLTGKELAIQKRYVGEANLIEHPSRADFYDTGNLVALDSALVKPGVPVPENATDASKTADTGMGTVIVAVTGATTNLTSGATRVITATLKRNNVTEAGDSSTVVTFASSGAGSVTGTGTSTASSGVATKTVTGGTTGSVTVTCSAPGHTSGTITFTVV